VPLSWIKPKVGVRAPPLPDAHSKIGVYLHILLAENVQTWELGSNMVKTVATVLWLLDVICDSISTSLL
jgi:hypothetical protein